MWLEGQWDGYEICRGYITVDNSKLLRWSLQGFCHRIQQWSRFCQLLGMPCHPPYSWLCPSFWRHITGPLWDFPTNFICQHVRQQWWWSILPIFCRSHRNSFEFAQSLHWCWSRWGSHYDQKVCYDIVSFMDSCPQEILWRSVKRRGSLMMLAVTCALTTPVTLDLVVIWTLQNTFFKDFRCWWTALCCSGESPLMSSCTTRSQSGHPHIMKIIHIFATARSSYFESTRFAS